MFSVFQEIYIHRIVSQHIFEVPTLIHIFIRTRKHKMVDDKHNFFTFVAYTWISHVSSVFDISRIL